MNDPTTNDPEPSDDFGASVIERTTEVFEGFAPDAIDGLDVLRCVVRFEDWLGQKATKSQLSNFADSLVLAYDGKNDVMDLIDGESMIVPCSEGHLVLARESRSLETIKSAIPANGEFHLFDLLKSCDGSPQKAMNRVANGKEAE